MLLKEQIDRLFERQLQDWQLVHDNYAALDRLVTREVTFHVEYSMEDPRIVLQYNPERLRSSSANIDDASIHARPCFLCNENQPKEQETLLWDGRYKIQVNPYPIFSRHLTISSLEHTPQRIAGRIADMMKVSKDLQDFVVFYNGPYSGASAPDHMHFQAGLRNELPFCDEISSVSTTMLDINNQGAFYSTTRLGRPVFYIETTSIEQGEQWFNKLLSTLPVKCNHVEPLINVLCWCEKGSWSIAVFPRRKHRPACYGTNEDQFVISPASVDMGGLWAVAREEDFNNLTPHDVKLIFLDVCLAPEDVKDISENLIQH